MYTQWPLHVTDSMKQLTAVKKCRVDRPLKLAAHVWRFMGPWDSWDAASHLPSQRERSYCWWFRNPIPNHRLDGAKTLVNNGINYQPQLVFTPDFWTATPYSLPLKAQTSGTMIFRSRPVWCQICFLLSCRVTSLSRYINQCTKAWNYSGHESSSSFLRPEINCHAFGAILPFPKKTQIHLLKEKDQTSTNLFYSNIRSNQMIDDSCCLKPLELALPYLY